MRELNIKTDPKCCWPVVWDGDKVCEVICASDADEAYVLLTALCDGAVGRQEEQGRVHGNCCIVDHSARWIMKRHDGKVPKVEPRSIKEALQIVHEAINDGAAIELSTHSVENQASIDWEGFKGTLGSLESIYRGILGLILG